MVRSKVSKYLKRPDGCVLALPASDLEVPGSNHAGGGFQLMTVRRFISQSLSSSSFPSSRYDLNNVERDKTTPHYHYYYVQIFRVNKVILINYLIADSCKFEQVHFTTCCRGLPVDQSTDSTGESIAFECKMVLNRNLRL